MCVVSRCVFTPDQQLEQLKISIHSIKDPERKNEIQSKIIVARSKLEDAKKASLLDGGISDNVQMSSVARSQASLEVLQKSHQQLLETEEVGNGIIENLDQQEETMRHTTSNVSSSSRMGMDGWNGVGSLWLLYLCMHG